MSQKLKNTKVVLDSALQVAESIIDMFEDGKASFLEVLSIAGVLFKLRKIAPNVKAAGTEMEEFDTEERAELKAHFQKNFDLNDDDAEETAETIFAWLADGYHLFTTLFKKKKK